MNPTLIHTAPYEFLPLKPHVSLHPEKGHIGINTVVQDLGKRRGLIPDYKPMQPVLQAAYSENGYIWEDALAEQHKRRMSQRPREHKLHSNPQVKLCLSGIHMIPDDVLTKKPWPSTGPTIGFLALMKALAISRPQSMDEFKWTCGKPPERAQDLLKSKWAWLVVTHCYAFHLEVNTVRFVVCWVGYKPEPIEYVFRYNASDKEEAWEMVVEHQARMQKQREKKK